MEKANQTEENIKVIFPSILQLEINKMPRFAPLNSAFT